MGIKSRIIRKQGAFGGPCRRRITYAKGQFGEIGSNGTRSARDQNAKLEQGRKTRRSVKLLDRIVPTNRVCRSVQGSSSSSTSPTAIQQTVLRGL